MIESEAFSICLYDSGSGGVCEFEGADPHALRELEKSIVIGDRSNNSDNSAIEGIDLLLGVFVGGFFEEFGDRADNLIEGALLLLLALEEAILAQNSDNSGDGDGVSIKPRLVESLMDGFIELGVGSPVHEGVELRMIIDGTLMRVLR